MNLIEQAVILCGGLGTRLKPFTNDTPKPMILCNGKPFLYYLLEQLNEKGISKFLLLTGYFGEKIQEYFKDGSEFGWQIEYSKGPVEWDTGKRIWEAKNLIQDKFLLMYSDNIVPFPIEQLFKIHEQNKLPLTFMITPKIPGNISLGEENIVYKYDNNRSEELNYVEIGYMIVEKSKTFSYFENPDCSFSKILKKMSEDKKISAFVQNDKYHSISDPERWKIAEKYLERKKIVLIDRDGVINVKAPKAEYISTWEKFQWIEDTREAMKILSREEFKFIIISNQAGIARGMIKTEELDRIHKNLIKELAKENIDILSIYYCPHHWDENCECRKPKAGLFYKASKEFFLRLDQTVYIGDDIRDTEAAWNAGCKSILIHNKEEIDSEKQKLLKPIIAKNMLDAIDFIRGIFK